MSIQQLTIANVHLERSQKVLNVEKALARTFVKLGNQIQNDKQYPSLSLLRIKYNTLVYDNIRSALSIIQQIASRYVNDKTKTNPYPTSVDINLIKEQTQKTLDSFWRKIQIAIQTENTPLSSYLTMTATVAATSSLAKFTQLKINEIQKNSELLGGSFGDIYSTEEDWAPETDIIRQSKRKPKSKRKPRQSKRKPKLLWIARLDEKTCIQLPNGDPGCGALNGTSWDFDDPTIPVPGELGPLGTHPHCRCIIDLIMPEDPRYQYL